MMMMMMMMMRSPERTEHARPNVRANFFLSIFSLNILLRVFSIPGGECVSIVLAGLAFSRPPPCNIRGGCYYCCYCFFFVVPPPF